MICLLFLFKIILDFVKCSFFSNVYFSKNYKMTAHFYSLTAPKSNANNVFFRRFLMIRTSQISTNTFTSPASWTGSSLRSWGSTTVQSWPWTWRTARTRSPSCSPENCWSSKMLSNSSWPVSPPECRTVETTRWVQLQYKWEGVEVGLNYSTGYLTYLIVIFLDLFEVYENQKINFGNFVDFS